MLARNSHKFPEIAEFLKFEFGAGEFFFQWSWKGPKNAFHRHCRLALLGQFYFLSFLCLLRKKAGQIFAQLTSACPTIFAQLSKHLIVYFLFSFLLGFVTQMHERHRILLWLVKETMKFRRLWEASGEFALTTSRFISINTLFWVKCLFF